jgi:WD40 repeat protein
VRSDLLVWRYADRSLLLRLFEHDGGILCLAFSQDRRLLATHGEDGRVTVWDMVTGNTATHIPMRPALTALPPSTSSVQQRHPILSCSSSTAKRSCAFSPRARAASVIPSQTQATER